jgi:hypothetical protein
MYPTIFSSNLLIVSLSLSVSLDLGFDLIPAYFSASFSDNQNFTPKSSSNS